MPKCFNVPGSLTGFLYHIGGCKVLILRANNHVHLLHVHFATTPFRYMQHSATCAFCYIARVGEADGRQLRRAP